MRLIGVNGQQVGLVPINKALALAAKYSVDLVEIVNNSNPPVCRLMDYGKFLFEQSKKKAYSRKKQKQMQVKEVKLRPVTDIGDYQIKLRNLIKFLKKGDKVKVTLKFRGREMSHKELGIDMLKRMTDDTVNYGIIENPPKMEGRNMIMVIGPKNNK